MNSQRRDAKTLRAQTWLERKKVMILSGRSQLSLKDIALLLRELNRAKKDLSEVVHRFGTSRATDMLEKRINSVRDDLKAHRGLLEWERDRQKEIVEVQK